MRRHRRRYRGGICVGAALVHPDKPPQLWINEVAVSPAHWRRGIAKAIVAALISVGRELGCTEAWVLTDEANVAARALYRSAGGTETAHLMVSFPLDAQGGET